MSDNKNTERLILPDRIEGELNLDPLYEDIDSSVLTKVLEEVSKEDLQQIRESLRSVSPETPNFLIHQEDLKEISLPNLNQDGTNLLSNNEKIQGLYFPSLEDHDKVTDALISAGIDIKNFSLVHQVVMK